MKTLKADMAYLGLNPKKEFLLFGLGILLLVGVGAVLLIVQGQPVYLLIPVLGGVLFGYFFFTRYKRKIRKENQREVEEFVRLFTYFQVYLNDGYNIYTALTSLIPFASSRIGEKLEKLVADIEEDKTITPFVGFASNFDDIQVRQVMLSIYQMVDQGTNEAYLRQFRHIFGRLSDQRHALYKQRRIEKVQNLSFLPLVGSGLSMVMLVAALIEIIGGVLNGF